jgi:hypothetical protein
VRSTFKPEFLNRLDDVVVFDALGTEELARIVDLQIASLARRLQARRLTLTVSDAARDWLTLTGFDPVYGARPLRRLVQKAIGDTLARALLSGDVRDGDEVVVDRRGRRRRAHRRLRRPRRGVAPGPGPADPSARPDPRPRSRARPAARERRRPGAPASAACGRVRSAG